MENFIKYHFWTLAAQIHIILSISNVGASLNGDYSELMYIASNRLYLKMRRNASGATVTGLLKIT